MCRENQTYNKIDYNNEGSFTFVILKNIVRTKFVLFKNKIRTKKDEKMFINVLFRISPQIVYMSNATGRVKKDKSNFV